LPIVAAVAHTPEVGLEHLTLLGVSPPDLVSLARDAGFDSVGLRISAATPAEQPWPMLGDTPMLAETVARLADTGVAVLDVEVVKLRPDLRREDYKPTLETGARLGARHVTVNSDDPDLERATEAFARLVADAGEYGLRPVIEAIPFTELASLEQALDMAERSGGGGILLDTLHLQRAGDDLERLRSIDAQLLSYVQVCDGPLALPSGLSRPERLPRSQPTEGDDRQVEARALRLLPGDGELPLADMLTATAVELPVSVEAPDVRMVERLGPLEFARRARAAVDTIAVRRP
jgi:sugar phosphate isomerase/epimerase